MDENLAALQAAIASSTAGVTCQQVVIEAEAGWALAMEGRFADLVLPPPLQAGDEAPPLMAEDAEYALLNAGRPMLLIPEGAVLTPQGHALVAWDGSQPAARAVSDALPLLALASHVTVVVVAGADGEDEKEAGGERLLQWLAAHGVEAWLRIERGGQPGEFLLRLARDLGAACWWPAAMAAAACASACWAAPRARWYGAPACRSSCRTERTRAALAAGAWRACGVPQAGRKPSTVR